MPLPEYTVRHSPKIRNIRLKVTPADGLCVVVPRGYDETKIPSILQRKKTWIADALIRAGEARRFLEPQPVMHLPGSLRLAALGETWAVTYSGGEGNRGMRLSVGRGALVLSGRDQDRDAVVRKLKGWLRAKVRDGLFPIVEQLATKHRLPFGALLVKNQRTRWASCSARRNLAVNIKLLFLPPALVRYALIHELCHTIHMDHSAEFWQLVASHESRFRVLDQSLREAWKIVPRWTY